MNWDNKNSGPWGTNGGNNNPWGKGPSSRDFENTIKKAKDKFGKYKIGRPRNISYLVIIGLLIW